MFSARFDSLPPPPFCDLKGSLDKLIHWSSPLLSEGEIEASKRAADSFGEREGRALQEELNKLRTDGDTVLDLVPYWKGWYLRQRDALPVNVNPFYLFDPASVPREEDFCRLAARLTLGAASFCLDLDKGRVPQDSLKGFPLCMRGYDDMFRSSRGAFRETDRIVTGDPDSLEGRSVLVLVKGRLHLLPVISSGGSLRGLDDLTEALRSLVERSAEDELPIGLMTCPPRDEAADMRSALTEDEANGKTLRQMEGALFALCLDGKCGTGMERAARHFLFDQGENRWFEKSFQLIVTSDGLSGINFEHSSRDGTHMGPLVREIQSRSGLPFPQEDRPEKGLDLYFNLSQELLDRLKSVKEGCMALRKSLIQRPFLFDRYGREHMKAAGVSPDCFVQMAMMIAQRKLWPSWMSVYESVQMRRFQGGRTEGTRPITAEAVAFVKAFEAEADREALRAALKDASKAHKSRISLCMAGQAPEGHLALLRQVWLGYGPSMGIDDEPGLYRSPAWLKMTKNYLSSSTTSGEGLALAGYGPVEHGGLSARYLSRPDRLVFHIGSWSCDGDLAERFIKALDDALRDMEDI